jgi:hypothetical protein
LGIEDVKGEKDEKLGHQPIYGNQFCDVPSQPINVPTLRKFSV